MTTRGLKTLLHTNTRQNFNSLIHTCITSLETLTSQRKVTQATILHTQLIKLGIFSDRHVSVKLLTLYLNHRKTSEADRIIKSFSGFNLVAHNCLITASLNWGDLDNALKLFDEMPERNEVSWTAVISGLMKCGRVDEAMRYFERNPFENVVSWTAGINGFVRNGMCFNGLVLFKDMLVSEIRPNEVTFTSVVKGCAELCDYGVAMSVFGVVVKTGFEGNLSVCNSLITLGLRLGDVGLARRVFDGMEEKDVVSWTAMLDVHVEMGDMREARRVFDRMPVRNEVSWSAMIARYGQSGCFEEALELFSQMLKHGFVPTVSCFSSVVNSLANLKGLYAGMNIHAHIVKLGVEGHLFISSSLIDFYCKCGKMTDGHLMFDSVLEKGVVSWNSIISGYSVNGQMEEAKKLFDSMPVRNNVSWNCIIAGYLENEQLDEVFEVFNEMLCQGETPTKSTFSSVLCACASITKLERGKYLHGKSVKFGFECDTFVATALVDMYAKSGEIESAKSVFDRMPEKNDVSWTVMIQGLAENGFAAKALEKFKEMERTSSVAHNELMLLFVLFACSHAGLVDEGLQYFNSMETVYGIKPNERHYTCVVDMLSRSGRLSEAEEFVNSMPFQPETNAWAALLSGCNTYKNKEIAERAAMKFWELGQNNSAGYVLLSNIYASDGQWIDVLNVRRLMKEKGLKKSGACSWIEIRNKVHAFYSEDASHFSSAETLYILNLMRTEMSVLRNSPL